MTFQAENCPTERTIFGSKRRSMAAKMANWLQVAFWHFVEFQLAFRFGMQRWGPRYVCKKWKGRVQGARKLAGGWACKRNAKRRIFFLLKLEKQLPALWVVKAATLVSRLTTQKVRKVFTFFTMHFNFAELVLKLRHFGAQLFTHKLFFKCNTKRSLKAFCWGN